MEMSGDQWVPLAREKVWEALNDADVLKACLPGCQSVDKQSDTEFTATVNAKVGPVKSRFKGNVTLSDLSPPNGYKLTFQGQGAAGFTKGHADVSLADEGEGTRISYTASATVGGKLAQVGARLVDGAARKMANEFFGNLTKHLGGTVGEGGEKPAGQEPAGTSDKAGADPSAQEQPAAEAKPDAAQAAAAAQGPAEQPEQGDGRQPEAASSAGQGAAASAGQGAAPQEESRAQQPSASSPPPREEFPGGSNQIWVWILVAAVIIVVAWLLLR